MKKSEKEYYLSCFPSCPQEFFELMEGKYADNFAVFQAHKNNLFIHCYHRYYYGALKECQRYVFTPSGVCRYGFKGGKWSVMKFREPVFRYGFHSYYDSSDYTVLNKEAVKNTFLKYSGAEYFDEWNIITYLKFYMKHPAAEHLIKNGFKFSVFESWDLDWTATSLHSALKLNRSDARAISKLGRQQSYPLFLRTRSAYPSESTDAIFKLMDVTWYRFAEFQRISELTGVDVFKICRFLSANDISAFDYCDYIKQCQQLGLTLTDKSVNRPRNFDLIHDKYTAMIKINQTQQLDSKIAERVPGLQKLVMDYKDLTIIVPKCDADIQREGAILAHCVGSYSERHAHGKLNILFLRRKDNPKQPYYTIEVSSGGQIVQCRGFKNNVPAAGRKKKPPEIIEFEKVYQAFLDNIFIKKARTA